MQGGNLPFIIRRNQHRTLLPPESSVFDERVESYVRFVQAANAFIIFFELYESIRVIYLHFVFMDQCGEYSHFLTALGILNLVWILVSILGTSSINSKESYRVARFLYLLLLILASRITFYVLMEVKMTDAISDTRCDFIYQGGLYILTASLEGILVLILIFLTYVIKNYIQSWEEIKHREEGRNRGNNDNDYVL